MRLILPALILAFAVQPATVAADIQWRIINRPYLQGVPTGKTGVRVLWAYCRPGAVIDLGVGVGADAEEGEAVTVELASGGRTATLSGISLRRADFDTTGGLELRTTVAEKDPLFEVLRTGEPIVVTDSSGGSEEWNVEGLRSRVANFLRQCR